MSKLKVSTSKQKKVEPKQTFKHFVYLNKPEQLHPTSVAISR